MTIVNMIDRNIILLVFLEPISDEFSALPVMLISEIGKNSDLMGTDESLKIIHPNKYEIAIAKIKETTFIKIIIFENSGKTSLGGGPGIDVNMLFCIIRAKIFHPMPRNIIAKKNILAQLFLFNKPIAETNVAAVTAKKAKNIKRIFENISLAKKGNCSVA